MPPYFEHAVTTGTPSLAELGYTDVVSERPDVVELWKSLGFGVTCGVRFQLNRYAPPTFEFQVTLIRRRTPNVAGPGDFQPLFTSVHNLLRGHYKLPTFEPDVAAWNFSDETSLRQQLAQVEALLRDVGIEWLEDPKANMDWMFPAKPNPEA